jgi:hypothetical protein
MNTSRLVLVGAVTALLAACGGSDDDTGATGTLKLGVTDAPVDVADAVVVQFSGVELKPVGGPPFSINLAPRSIDLLAQQGTERAMLLDDAAVAAGDYEWMRLKVNAEPNVDDSHIEINGERCELRVPSGAETGLKVIRGFTVGVGSVTDLTIDFNLSKSIVQPPGQRADEVTCDGQAYLLKPVLRVVDNLQVGAISGTVDGSLVAAASCASSSATPGKVYLYGPYAAGESPPTPDDLDENPDDGDPITTARVELDPSSNYAYTIGFVPAGDYVVAYTCDEDDLLQDATAVDPTEIVTFTPAAGATVTVTPNATSTLDFQ